MTSEITKFCETIFQVLEYQLYGTYSKKPGITSIISACQGSDKSKYSQSIRVVTPRVAQALYTLRSERGAIHKGEVSSVTFDNNFMMQCCDWLLAELVRIYHKKSPVEIEPLLKSIVERKFRLIETFEDGSIKLHLKKKKYGDKVLALLYSTETRMTRNEIISKTQSYPQIADAALKILNEKDYIHINISGAKITSKGINHLDEVLKSENVNQKESN